MSKTLGIIIIVGVLVAIVTFLIVSESVMYDQLPSLSVSLNGLSHHHEELAAKDRYIQELQIKLAELEELARIANATSSSSSSISNTMTLVSFAFTGGLDFNTEFFLRHGVFESDYVDFVFVQNGVEMVDMEAIFRNTNGRPKNVFGLPKRENEGWDFCMHKLVLDTYMHRKNYTHFVLMNRTVRGPFLPSYFKGTWVEAVQNMFSERIAVTGLTFNCLGRQTDDNLPSPISEYPGIHLQSMFLAMDTRAMKVYRENMRCINDKVDAINTIEVGATRWFLMQGNISLIPMSQLWKGVDMDDRNDVVERCNRINSDPWPSEPNGHVDGIHVHPLETIFIKTNRFVTKEVEKFTEWQDLVWRKKREMNK